MKMLAKWNRKIRGWRNLVREEERGKIWMKREFKVAKNPILHSCVCTLCANSCSLFPLIVKSKELWRKLTQGVHTSHHTALSVYLLQVVAAHRHWFVWGEQPLCLIAVCVCVSTKLYLCEDGKESGVSEGSSSLPTLLCTISMKYLQAHRVESLVLWSYALFPCVLRKALHE